MICAGVTAMAATRHGTPLTNKERVQFEAEQAEVRRVDKEVVATRAKAAGMKKRTLRADDGSVQEVWSFAASYHAMGFQDHQIHAAERFGRDWEAAYRTIKGQGFEFGVDGGRSRHGAHLSQVDAQTRLHACRGYVGKRGFEVIVAIVVNGAAIRDLAPRARTHDRNIRQDIDNAFNDLDGFYTGTRHKDRIWEAVEKFNAERAAMIELAEREVG